MYQDAIVKLALLCSAILFIAACSPEASDPEPEHRGIEEIADEFLAATLERNPNMGTYYAIEGARHDRLYDNSLDALAEWQAREDAWLPNSTQSARQPRLEVETG